MAQMDRLDFREIANARISSRIKQVITLILTIILGMIISVSVNAQDHPYHKNKSRFYKAKFRTQINQYTHACTLLDKKRTQKPKTHFKFFVSNNKPKYKPMAEIDPPGTTRVTVTKPEPKQRETLKPITVAQNQTTPSSEKLEQLHKQEDKILKENHLPAPTSEKHEKIRKIVANNLKNKKDNQPILLAPLYFNYDQDEFSVVDMDPFLVAVEYALQGRTILIEGHTDADGNQSYNVQLSMKRVQKIRDLMQAMGVPDDRISVVGYGEEIAKHDNTTDQGKQLNRRVDFKAF